MTATQNGYLLETNVKAFSLNRCWGENRLIIHYRRYYNTRGHWEITYNGKEHVFTIPGPDKKGKIKEELECYRSSVLPRRGACGGRGTDDRCGRRRYGAVDEDRRNCP